MQLSNPHSRYFRISITDKCNLNCYFCHKEGQFNSSDFADLSSEDIIWSAGVAVESGFTKFKITGGEPTLREDLPHIIRGIKKRRAKDVSLTTNGIKLSRICTSLKNAGLDRINFSINSFNTFSFKHDCSGDREQLDEVIKGIDSAIKEGFENIKLNFIFSNPERSKDLKEVIEFSKNRNLRLSVLPILNYNLKPDDRIYSFDELYEMVKQTGIRSEKIIIDTDGLRQRLIITNSGAKLVLKMDRLSNRNPFKACAECHHKSDCLEGIFPYRLSSKGALSPCLAKGIPEVNIRSAIERRDASEFKQILTKINNK